jgi:hypothetical protein
VPSEENRYRHAINVRSVHKPKDDNPQGCYAMLTISSNSNTTNNEAVSVEFIRFSYEIEKSSKSY